MAPTSIPSSASPSISSQPTGSTSEPTTAPTSIPTSHTASTTGNASPSSHSAPSSTERPSQTTKAFNVVSPSATSPPSATSSPSSGGIQMSGAQTGIVIAIVVLIGIVLVLFAGYVSLRALRVKYKDPKYLPGSYLKKKWTNWNVGYRATLNDPVQASLNRQARSRANIAANRALDRQASVRSVITLPPYREMAESELERTIGREGERDGLDTVTVFPETADEEEERREERMQAMYELRLQRRAQRAARAARENGSSTTSLDPNATQTSLTGLDMETGGSGRSTSELTAAVLNERQRRLSEVSYSDVGYSRADGSRIRSSSTASHQRTPSDSQPLLSDTGSTTGNRGRSGSVLSINTSVSNERPSMEQRASSELLSGVQGPDLGEARLPPSYEGVDWGDAPPYMSPVSPLSRSGTASSRANAQGALNVPLVRVIGASNPGSPMSPTMRHNERRDGEL